MIHWDWWFGQLALYQSVPIREIKLVGRLTDTLKLSRVSKDGSWHDRVMTKMSVIWRLRNFEHGGEDVSIFRAAVSCRSISLYESDWAVSEKSGDMRMYVCMTDSSITRM